MSKNDQTFRLSVCNREGDCERVKGWPLKAKGNDIHINADEVEDFIQAITDATDALEEAGQPAWADNFNLEKLRSRDKASRSD